MNAETKLAILMRLEDREHTREDLTALLQEYCHVDMRVDQLTGVDLCITINLLQSLIALNAYTWGR